jgi:3-hydroxybutyrate dehydrogenase
LTVASIECQTQNPTTIVENQEALMLYGKTAVITGSTSGIGLGIADSLARQGANIVLNGFGDVEGPIRQISALGVRVDYCNADMSDPDEIEQMMTYVDNEFGGADVLVNNAGIQYVAPVEDFPTEQWDKILAVNMSSVFHTTRLAIPGMRQKNWGRVINIASAHGLVASANKSAYVTAKHGVVGFTQTIGLETAETGVTVNAICPGWVLTPLVQKQLDDRVKREGISADQAVLNLLSEKQPSKKFVTVEELGGLAVFLCSPAADNVRGVAWPMDGGWTAQ